MQREVFVKDRLCSSKIHPSLYLLRAMRSWSTGLPDELLAGLAWGESHRLSAYTDELTTSHPLLSICRLHFRKSLLISISRSLLLNELAKKIKCSSRVIQIFLSRVLPTMICLHWKKSVTIRNNSLTHKQNKMALTRGVQINYLTGNYTASKPRLSLVKGEGNH